MKKALIGLLEVVAVAVGGAVVVFVVGMRRKYPPVVDTVRRVLRDVGNPRTMTSAGEPGDQNSVIHHVGRASGKAYRTPVTALPTDDGFVIALPYGTTTDWLRNVLAAGSAVLVREGVEHAVDQPRVVSSAEVAQHFSPGVQRTFRVLGVDECLLLRSAADHA